MSRAQRNLVWEWIASAVLVISVFVFSRKISQSWEWLRWFAIVVALLARAFFGQRGAPGEGGNLIREVVANHPWLNWWAGLCTVAIVSAALLMSQSFRHIAVGQALGLVLATVAVAFGPAIVLVERSKYLARAE